MAYRYVPIEGADSYAIRMASFRALAATCADGRPTTIQLQMNGLLK